MIWLLVIWIAMVALSTVAAPRWSLGPMGRVVRGLRARWRSGGAHPFDWTKD